jgi:hypothetical protein
MVCGNNDAKGGARETAGKTYVAGVSKQTVEGQVGDAREQRRAASGRADVGDQPLARVRARLSGQRVQNHREPRRAAVGAAHILGDVEVSAHGLGAPPLRARAHRHKLKAQRLHIVGARLGRRQARRRLGNVRRAR